jgi:hypothetical protein
VRLVPPFEEPAGVERIRKGATWDGPVELIEYEIELERTNGQTDRTSAILPSLTKGQRLTVSVDGGAADAEVVEVTKLTSGEPVKWKLIARELPPQP